MIDIHRGVPHLTLTTTEDDRCDALLAYTKKAQDLGHTTQESRAILAALGLLEPIHCAHSH